MGREARCTFEHEGRTFTGRALLETNELLLRADDLKASVPFAGATVEAKGGWLVLKAGRRTTRLELGADAARWADRIRNPPSLLKKLGIADGTAVAFVGPVDEDVRAQVEAGSARTVKAHGAAAVLLVAAATVADLDVLKQLRPKIAGDAAIWVTWRKGRKELTETHVRAAALEAGLVDVKVASVSDVWSGLKLVIRKADRGGTKG